MNYRQSIDKVLEEFKKNRYLLLTRLENKSYLYLCYFDYLKIIAGNKYNYSSFNNSYLKNINNEYHLITVTIENEITADQIDFEKVEELIIKYIFPEYDLKIFEHIKKKSLESFDSKIGTSTAECTTGLESGSVVELDLNCKKSVILINSFSEIQNIISTKSIELNNTDFLINNRVMMVNIKENKSVSITYNTTQNHFETFTYEKILIPVFEMDKLI